MTQATRVASIAIREPISIPQSQGHGPPTPLAPGLPFPRSVCEHRLFIASLVSRHV